MSFGAYRWAWMVAERDELSSPARHVLAHLAYRANYPHNLAWPTVNGQSRDTGLSPSTIRRARRELINAGLVFVTGTGGISGQQPVFRLLGRFEERPKGGPAVLRWWCDSCESWAPLKGCQCGRGVTVAGSPRHRDRRGGLTVIPTTEHRTEPATDEPAHFARRARSEELRKLREEINT